MARPPLRPLPPHGSTDWGALQFYRVLDEEERIAAERERLRALGWRPPRPAVRNASTYAEPHADKIVMPPHGEAGSGGAYTDLIERDRTYRQALEDEARRRVAARLNTAPVELVSDDLSSYRHNRGRFGTPISEILELGSLQKIRSLDPTLPPPLLSRGRGDAIGKSLIELLKLLGIYIAGEAGKPDRTPWPEPSRLPGDPTDQDPNPPIEPSRPDDISDPTSGFPDSSEEFSQNDLPNVPPHPDELTEPLPPQITDDLERFTKPPLPGFQQILDRFWQAGILIRGESASTRQDNQDIIDMVIAAMASCGWSAKHTHGAAEKERYLPGDGPGTAGSRYTDGAIEGTARDGRQVLYDFNTAQRLRDGRWVAYERRAEAAIRRLLSKINKLRTRFDVYPKSRGMDRELWRESVRPFVQDAVRALLDC